MEFKEEKIEYWLTGINEWMNEWISKTTTFDTKLKKQGV